MPFVKLDACLLDSTLWADNAGRVVFITALLMAEPRELREPMPQLAVDTLEQTGWTVPAGWYGFVAAAGAGIVRRAQVPEAEGLAALTRLGQPDLSSRTAAYDGRRLVRVDGGYIVLNFMAFRERDYTAGARARRYREHRHGVTSRRHGVTGRNVTQAEAEAEAEIKRESGADAPALAPGAPPAPADLMRVWNETVTRLPKVLKLTSDRERRARARLREDPDLEAWRRDIGKLDASDFAAGENDRGWKAGFDFLLSPGKLAKLREGAYDNSPKATPRQDPELSSRELDAASQFRMKVYGGRCPHGDPPCADHQVCIREIAFYRRGKTAT
jgi:hypothetical protein